MALNIANLMPADVVMAPWVDLEAPRAWAALDVGIWTAWKTELGDAAINNLAVIAGMDPVAVATMSLR